MSNKFNTFLNSFPPALTGYLVGYDAVAGTDTEQRWTIDQLNTLLASTLNLTSIANGFDNYLSVVGTATGGGTVTLIPAGVDADIDLIISSKGSGTVTFTGSLTIAADLDLGNNDLITGGGDVLTGGGDVNTANGSLLLGTGSIQGTSGDITLTTGNIILSNGNLTLSAAGTLDLAGGDFLTDTIAKSIAGFITVIDDLTVGVGAANKTVTTSGVTGNKDAPAAGQEPIELTLSGVAEADDESFFRGKVYCDTDLMTKTYLRASINVGLTADITSVQGGGLITSEFNQYSTVGTIGDCATLPVLAAEGYSAVYRYPYIHIIVRNDGANAMDIFPNTNGTINGGAADTPIVAAAASVTHLYGRRVGAVDTWFTA